jgi:uncharacterized membrane protein YjjB (DUF3815 family)
MKLINWISKSFTADKDGSSARKLSAFYAIVIMSGFITINKTDKDNATTMLEVWLLFAGVCLGMVTVQQLIEFIKGSKTEKKDENNVQP